MLIYKIFRRNEWENLLKEGYTFGAPVDLKDGYIHFSTAETLQETARKHFSQDKDLTLIACRSEELAKDIKWEKARKGDLFPHLYRQLNLDDIFWHHDLPLAKQPSSDSHIFPKLPT